MEKIRLDSRLAAVANLVRDGVTVADIGTDHAYLLAHLLVEKKIEKGIAADLRKGPLENARKTLMGCGMLDKVRLVLSDGLEELEDGDCDDIVIAGMGGILIKEILERTPWVFNENIHIIAQPMTHAEVLRSFFVENGFEILKESAATDGKHCYCIILARYNGEKRRCEKWYSYIGRLAENEDEISSLYINKIITALTKKLTAIKAAGIPDLEGLEKIVEEIKQKTAEVKNG